jgi:hypothetical protein
MNHPSSGATLLMNRLSGGAALKRRGVMVTISKKRSEAIKPVSALSEMDLDRVVGGFNPQPDPPGILAGQTRLTPSDFGIRARPIAG